MGKLKDISFNQTMEKCSFVASQKRHQCQRLNDNSAVIEKVLPLKCVAKFQLRNGALFHSIKSSRHRASNTVRCPNQGLQGTLAIARPPEPSR
jgi:hypothetical protein